jgi:hypothetical protein
MVLEGCIVFKGPRVPNSWLVYSTFDVDSFSSVALDTSNTNAMKVAAVPLFKVLTNWNREKRVSFKLSGHRNCPVAPLMTARHANIVLQVLVCFV